MAEYTISPEAQRDLNDIGDYISQHNVDAALAVLDSLVEKMALIAESPLIGRACEHLKPGLRRFPVGNYLLYYRPATHGVEIVRVFHGARNIRVLLE